MRIARVVGFITVLFTAWSQAQTRSVDVLAVEFPPISSLSAQNAGLAFELLRQRSLSADTQWVPVFLPPARASARIMRGAWCASFYPVFEAEQRQVVRLSDMPIRFSFLRKATDTRFTWEALDDFSGRSVAVLRDENSVPLFDSMRKAGLSLVYVESFQNGAQMVLLGRVDMALIDYMTYQNLERINRAKLQFAERPVVQMFIELYVNRDCADEVLPLLRQ